RYLNLRNMMAVLETRKALPVVNENDTVGVDEIKFGDNDILAGLVANAVDAEVTILLSDVDGFLMDGKVQDEVREVTAAVEAAASITVDAGGAVALRKNGKSLLAVGVTGCDGAFDVGDPVEIRDAAGSTIAKGLVNYSAADLRRIMGKKADEIENVLGYRPSDEIIHRDNLV